MHTIKKIPFLVLCIGMYMYSNSVCHISLYILVVALATTVELPTVDSLYFGNLHNADKRWQSQIIPYSLLYIATSV